jgi:ABC-type nitrate/sulfonate/bicarbonate transport system ATPase subunit
MPQPKLAIANVSKTFAGPGRDLPVLRGVDIHVNQGEFVSLIGPSGCGKSTLLHLVAGLEAPTAGTLTIDGHPHASRLGASGYMQQQPLLLPWKTVRENVMLGPVLQHQPPAATGHKADELLEKFGLAEFADRYPRVLSGGMAQKVALLRTILFNPDFLLMDEPFGALDALTRSAMQLWLLEVWGQFQSTVLCVTHDIREAVLLSDRIYVLSSRPATVVQEVAVDLPRPRRRELLSSPEALALEAQLEGLLLGGGDQQ